MVQLNSTSSCCHVVQSLQLSVFTVLLVSLVVVAGVVCVDKLCEKRGKICEQRCRCVEFLEVPLVHHQNAVAIKNRVDAMCNCEEKRMRARVCKAEKAQKGQESKGEQQQQP